MLWVIPIAVFDLVAMFCLGWAAIHDIRRDGRNQ